MTAPQQASVRWHSDASEPRTVVLGENRALSWIMFAVLIAPLLLVFLFSTYRAVRIEQLTTSTTGVVTSVEEERVHDNRATVFIHYRPVISYWLPDGEENTIVGDVVDEPNIGENYRVLYEPSVPESAYVSGDLWHASLGTGVATALVGAVMIGYARRR